MRPNRLACLVFALAAAVSASGVAAPAHADDMRVTVDQATVLRLPAPAAGVIVGNPSIAGVAVQSDRIVSITGRSFGLTNVIVLGHQGQVLYSGDVRVVGVNTNTVTVLRGTSQSRYDCAPRCERALDPGDSPEAWSEAATAVQGKAGLGRQP